MRSLNGIFAMGRWIPLAAAASALAFAGCAAVTAPPSLSPSPTAESSLLPTPTYETTVRPAPSPTPTRAALGDDSIGEVIVTDLVVRSAPGVGEDSAILQDDRLTDGDWVYVVEGPITVDGYDWLLAVELEDPFSGEVQSAGWIAAASREGEEWVVPVDPICPNEISVEAFAAVAEGLLLYCFGGQELSLEGAFGFCFHSDPVIQEPAWLGNYPCAFEKLDRPRVSHWPTVSVHLHPDADVHASPEAGPLRITGRFDAPEAKTCRYVDGAELTFPEFHAALLPFQCRASFVVESTTPISP